MKRILKRLVCRHKWMNWEAVDSYTKPKEKKTGGVCVRCWKTKEVKTFVVPPEERGFYIMKGKYRRVARNGK